MKKLFALLLSVLMVLTMFASCTKTDEKGSDVKTNSLTKEEIFEKSMTASSRVENYASSASVLVDVDLMGENVVLDMDMNMAASMKDKLMFVDFLMDIMGEEIGAQAYISYGENAGIYTRVFGEWIKETFPQETIDFYNDLMENQSEYNSKLMDYIKVVSADEVDYKGKKAYEIKCEYDMDILAMLEDMEMSIEDIYADAGLDFGEQELEMVKALFEDLGTVEMIQYADAESFLPVGGKCDMTSLGNKLAENVVELLAEMQGVSVDDAKAMGVAITFNNLSIEFDSYDYDFEGLTIPEEALAAESLSDETLGIIGGADGPTEIIVA